MTKGISDSLDAILPGSSPEEKQLAWKLASQSDDPIGVLRGYKGLRGSGDFGLTDPSSQGTGTQPSPGINPQPSAGGSSALPTQPSIPGLNYTPQQSVEFPYIGNNQSQMVGYSLNPQVQNQQPQSQLQSQAPISLPTSVIGTGGLLAAAGVGQGIKAAFTPGVEKAEFTSSKPIFQSGIKGIEKVAGPIGQGGAGVLGEAGIPTGQVSKIATPSAVQKLVSKQAWKYVKPFFSVPGLGAAFFVGSGGIQDTLRFAGLEKDAQAVDQLAGNFRDTLGKAGGGLAQAGGQALNAITGAFPKGTPSAEEAPITKQEVAQTRTQTIREKAKETEQLVRQMGQSAGALDQINNTLIPLYEKGLAEGTVSPEEHAKLLNYQSQLLQDPSVQKEIATRGTLALATQRQSAGQDIPEIPPAYEGRYTKVLKRLKGAEKSVFNANFLIKAQQGNIAALENFLREAEARLGIQ